MKEIHVQSRIIKGVFFDEGQLRIWFQNGEIRDFTGVPEKEVTAMCNSASPGQHYLHHIRKHFPRKAA